MPGKASAAVLAAVLSWGCGRGLPGDGPAAGSPGPGAGAAAEAKTHSRAEPATVAELLRAPGAYAGRDVAVKGVFGGICCASDWFLKDGMDAIEVYGTRLCPAPSRSRLRSKVTVIGTVMVRNNQPALTSKELRFE